MKAIDRLGGVLVVGHGSGHRPAEGGESVRNLGGRVGEVLPGVRVGVGFLRQEPLLEGALSALWSGRLNGDLVVLPMMMADGFGIREARRRVGEVANRLGKTARWGRLLGGHARVSGVLDALLDRISRREGGRPDDLSVVVVGHGTERLKGSGDTVEEQARRLRSGLWASVDVGFLEQEPRLSGLRLADLPGRIVVIVPYMVGEGPHTVEDIPEAVGLGQGAREGWVDGKRVVCSGAVGADDGMVAVALACIDEAFDEG